MKRCENIKERTLIFHLDVLLLSCGEGYNAFRTRTVLSASVLQDSKETVLRSVKVRLSFFFLSNLYLQYFLVVVDLSISVLLLTDINECKERKACQCPECSCKNTWGSYECSCSGFTSEISVGCRLAYNVIIGTCSRWGVPRLQI